MAGNDELGVTTDAPPLTQTSSPTPIPQPSFSRTGEQTSCKGKTCERQKTQSPNADGIKKHRAKTETPTRETTRTKPDTTAAHMTEERKDSRSTRRSQPPGGRVPQDSSTTRRTPPDTTARDAVDHPKAGYRRTQVRHDSDELRTPQNRLSYARRSHSEEDTAPDSAQRDIPGSPDTIGKPHDSNVQGRPSTPPDTTTTA